MSGPKVVRIVTREEILEICHGQLARVDAALAEWTRIGRRNNCIDEDAAATATRRRDALAALIATDRFMDLQKQASVEEAFLREDIQQRLQAVAAEQAIARSRERRGMEAAQTVLRRLRSTGQQIAPELIAGLERGDAEALAGGFAALADATVGSRPSDALASRLRDDAPAASFAEWLSTQPQPTPDPAVERIAARLDALGMMAETAQAENWRARLAEADRADPARRNLLLDGLEVETGRALTDARRRQALRADLMLVRAELAATNSEDSAAKSDADSLDAGELEREIASTKKMLDDIRAARAAAARRAAVLEGLVGLGYEVTEGMSTSLAEDGKLVLRSAARPDYGVEVSAVAGAERMQMRPVAFEAEGRGPDPGRDRDAETIWCGDVSTLQDALARAGGGLVIERALPVGATPLKRIAVENSPDPGAAAEASTLRQRTLR